MQQQTNSPRFLLGRVILIGMMASYSFGCGRSFTPNNAGTTDSSSRLFVNNNNSNTNSTEASPIAYCNKLENTYFTAQLQVFYDQTNKYHPEFIRLHFPKIHSDFEKADVHLVLRKWKASYDGTTFQDDTPLKLRAERMSDLAPVTNYRSALQWDVLKMDLQNFTSSSDTMNDVFSEFSFVVDLKDFDGSYDVLKFSLYKKNGDWIEDWNMLMPAFYADPTKYEKDQNPVLVDFHPLANATSTTFAEDYFESACIYK
jgi:hypothetical protein